MENILLVNKPKGLTSNDVCAKIKKRFKFKKIGHAGTLDPLATGLLILGIEKGTKKLSQLILEDKEYIATITFNKSTSTYDAEGDVVNSTLNKVNLEEIKNVLKKYNNVFFYQYPPVYSAIKINGKKLYEYARNNQYVELPKRKVSINKIEFINFDYENQTLKIKLNVSKGFYVRSFAHDLGIELNNFAYLSDLFRTKSGVFKIEDSYNLETLLSESFSFNK